MKKLNIGNDSNRKFIAIIPAIVLSPAIYVGIVMIWIFSISYYPTKDFDRNEWISNTEERYRMSEDIIESDMLIGKNRADVIMLLGTDYGTHNESSLTYELGFVPGLFNIDPDYLEIIFEMEEVLSVHQYGR